LLSAGQTIKLRNQKTPRGISEAKHRRAEDRHYRYEPTFLLRGLT
jgi:hypothetical protein